jgi:predicted RNase H-like nuclease (RuvC/YqgF family)
MQLTTARLKQIIKEELEAITNEMTETETETEVDSVDAEIASLEQQLAEAKKKVEMAKGKKAAMKGDKMPAKRMDTGKRPPAAKKMKGEDHKMMPAKRHDKKGY